MFLHVGLLVKRFEAVGAVERADVGVYEQVRAEGRRAPESLAAALTGVRPVGAVLHPVSRQASHVTERLVTRDALERSLPRNVRPPRVNLPTHAHELVARTLNVR